jgi:hypothetical protein
MAELTLSELKEQKRPFAEVREFNFNVRLKSQNDHLNQRWLGLGSFAAHFVLPFEYPETPRYAHIAKATIDGIETAHRIRKGQLDDRSISDYKHFMELAA